MADDPHFTMLGETMLRQERRAAHVILSQDGTVDHWQGPMVELFGWTAEEALGRSLTSLIIPEPLWNAHWEGLQRWSGTRVTVVACKHFRVTGIHKNGEPREVYLDVQIVRDESGIRFLGWVSPVTVDTEA